jgi:5-methylcytosine-specific restriction endonuclease McrA
MAKGRNGLNKYDAMVFERVLATYNHCCAGCGSPMDLERDHVTPRSASGSDEESNLQILCHHCNNKKNGMKYFPKLAPRMPVDSCREIMVNRQMFCNLIDNLKGR